MIIIMPTPRHVNHHYIGNKYSVFPIYQTDNNIEIRLYLRKKIMVFFSYLNKISTLFLFRHSKKSFVFRQSSKSFHKAWQSFELKKT